MLSLTFAELSKNGQRVALEWARGAFDWDAAYRTAAAGVLVEMETMGFDEVRLVVDTDGLEVSAAFTARIDLAAHAEAYGMEGVADDLEGAVAVLTVRTGSPGAMRCLVGNAYCATAMARATQAVLEAAVGYAERLSEIIAAIWADDQALVGWIEASGTRFNGRGVPVGLVAQMRRA